MKKLLFIAMLSALPALAQPSNPSIVLVGTAPSGSCSVNLPDQQVITTGALYSCQNGTWAKFGTGTGSGSVTSVTFTGDGTVLSSTPSGAVTTSGTLAATLATVADNLFLAGPASGPAAAPTYRAVNLASADVTGVLPIANGGAGNGTYTLTAFCTGVVSASNGITNYLAPAGNSTLCNGVSSTSTLQAVVVPIACTMQSMYVRLAAAGSAAGSGVVTILHNNSASTLTCTTGTTTACSDLTHTVSFAAGDVWAVGITNGQASDTLNGVKVSAICR